MCKCSINDFWYSKSGNLKVIWWWLYVMNVLAAFIGKKGSDKLPGLLGK
jgi:hypothetical protein